MQFETQIRGVVNDAPDVARIMKQVLIALLPGIVVSCYFFGWGVLINLMLSVVFAVVLEALMLWVRGRSITVFLTDFSAIVTACLFAMTLPPLVIWWIPLVGLFFAIVVAKHCYGGLGYNPFNPAMVGYAVLIVSFPLAMSQWPASQMVSDGYTFKESLSIVLGTTNADWDGMTQATPLDYVRSGIIVGQPYSSLVSSGASKISLSAWQWIAVAYLVGGLYLLRRKIIRWHIPVSILLSLTTIASVFWLIDDARFASPSFHLVTGAVMIGAFFIATDPVSASITPLGQILYGASIGLFVYIIRTWGGYPDSVAFAVLIMNMAVPMLDYYTKPRVFGHPDWKTRMKKRG